MRWVPKTVDAVFVTRLAAELSSRRSLDLKDRHLVSTLAQLLVLRDITEPDAAEHFLAPSLSHLHSPYLMTGMKPAVDQTKNQS
jgi:hypothetical protein